MMSKQIPVAICLLLSSPLVACRAQLPENYLRRWEDPAVQRRIDDGIEKNRKSDVVLRILDAAGDPAPDAGVRIEQTAHEFLFGCNLFVLGQMNELDTAYEEAFLELFNFATAAFYWDDLEPAPGEPRFTEGSSPIWRRPPPDRALAFAQEHGLVLKGHPLMWANMTHNPAWMPKDAQELRQRYLQRFREIAQRYAADIPIWEGVNESLVAKDDFPLYSKDERDHPPFVRWAFEEEQKLFRPENVLMINEVTSFNWPADGTNRYYRQCAKLLNDGVGVEGIGFQFHFFDRKELNGYLLGEQCDPNTLLDAYEMFAELGVPLWITEITLGSEGEDGPAIQERAVRDLYRLWFSTPKMAGITWWNLGDGTAYGSENSAGGGLADAQMKPKPAYAALDQLINHDWKTSLQAKPNRAGEVAFRGFHGDYRVAVTHEGTTEFYELTVSPSGTNDATLRLP